MGGILLAPISAQESSELSVYQIAKSGNQRVLAVTYNEGASSSRIDLFDSLTSELLRTVDSSPIIPRRIALSPTGDRIAYVGADEFGLFDTNTGTRTPLLSNFATSIEGLVWNPVEAWVAWAQGSGVYITDATSGAIVRTIGAGSERIVAMAWSADGERLATSHYAVDPFNPGVANTTVKVWDLSSSETDLVTPVLVLEDRGGGELAWSPDDTRLAILENSQLMIFDVVSRQIVIEIPFDEEYRYTVVWNTAGSLLATGGNIIRIWDTSTWQIERTISVNEPVSTLQWSLDGQHIFHGGGPEGLYRDDIPVADIVLTPTPTDTPTFTPTYTPTHTPTPTNTPTFTPTNTPTHTPTDTPTNTPSPTPDTTCTLSVGASDMAGLIAAITTANGSGTPHTICLAQSTYTLTTVNNSTNGANGLPSIASNITILGNGAISHS